MVTSAASVAKGAGKRPVARPTAAQDDAALRLVATLDPGFPLTHLEKVLYPDEGVRKAELIAYYAALADWILPHIAGRPLVLLRCPEGRRKGCFIQKHLDASAPAAVQRTTIAEATKRGEYGFVRDLPGLLALAQLGALELHTWCCRVDQLERPDLFVFDLDPDEGLPFARTVEAALTVREQLARLGLESFVKTTGGKGLHVIAPVRPKHGWDEHKGVARALATTIMKAEPERYTTNPRKEARRGKVFLDYLRNGRGASAIAPYSPRARAGAPIAVPISWSELTAGVRPSLFDLRSVIKRLEHDPRDPWRGFFDLRQDLPNVALRRRLEHT